jgi:hypothetical protein
VTTNNLDGEKIIELSELDKMIDIETIPFRDLLGYYIGFICSVLMTNENLELLNIDSKEKAMINYYVIQGKAYLDKTIAKETLNKGSISAWEEHDRLQDGSAAKHLLRLVICCLGDQEDTGYNLYGSEMLLEAFFSMLLCLGEGYCRMFRYYIQDQLGL